MLICPRIRKENKKERKTKVTSCQEKIKILCLILKLLFLKRKRLSKDTKVRKRSITKNKRRSKNGKIVIK